VFLFRWWFLIDLFKLRVNATPPPAAVPADSPHQIEVGVVQASASELSASWTIDTTCKSFCQCLYRIVRVNHITETGSFKRTILLANCKTYTVNSSSLQ
jgi:hypothetical protein